MPDPLDLALARALHRHLGPDSELVSRVQLTGGANASTSLVDLRVGGEPRRLILRRAMGEGEFAMTLAKSVEAQVQSAATAHGARAARVAFVLAPEDELGDGYAMDFVAGEASPARFLGDEPTRRALASDVGPVLAAIHQVPLAALPRLPIVSTEARVRELRDAYDGFGSHRPVFEVAFRALLENLPPERPPTLVHGDFRTGNLLVGPEGIRAVLDWELAHVGSPIEDLGWLCVAAWRFGRLGDRAGGFASIEALRAGYVGAGGPAFDEAELRFWEVYGTLRWGVICLYQVFAHLRGAIPSIERAAIGRRVSEVELDLLRLLP